MVGFLIVVSLFVAVVLTGCGGDDEPVVITPYQGDVMVSDGGGNVGERELIEEVPRVNLAPTPFSGLLQDLQGRGVRATPGSVAPSGGGVVGVDEEIEGVGSSEGQVMSDGSGESPGEVVPPRGAVSSVVAVSAAESVAGNHAMATVVPVLESERAPIVEATAVAARERFSATCTACESAEGSSPAQRALFFQSINYADFVLAGHYLDWVDEGRFIEVLLAPDESEPVPCEEGVVGNSLSGENPTLNNYSHSVYVFVEHEGGRRGCVGLSKDIDLNDIDRTVLVGDAVDGWRPASMDVALEFFTDEKRSNNSVAYSRLPRVEGETAGFPIDGEPLLCGPDYLPIAFWDDRNGFYAVSNDDRLALYPRASEENAAGAVGTGWHFVLHTDENRSLVQAFCWRVPNWPDVPVRRCPICQTGLR